MFAFKGTIHPRKTLVTVFEIIKSSPARLNVSPSIQKHLLHICLVLHIHALKHLLAQLRVGLSCQTV